MNTKTGVALFIGFAIIWTIGMIAITNGFDNAGIIVFILTMAIIIAGCLSTFVCSLILIFAAFRQDITTGLLFLFVPFYAYYFAFIQYRDPNKGLVLTGWLAGTAILIIYIFVGYYNALSDMWYLV